MDKKKAVIMDGNEAAAYVSYAFTEVAGIFPITPSSPMADHVDEWAAAGMKNIFGQPVKLMELQAESGAVGAAGQIFRIGHRRIKAGTAVPYGQGAALPVGGKAQPRFPACSRRPQGIGDQIQQHSPQQYCVTACQQGGAGLLISEDHTGPFGQRDHFGGQIPA